MDDECARLSDMDMDLFWARFPLLPLQCFKSVRTIAADLGRFMALRTTLQEVLNGATLTICVQLSG